LRRILANLVDNALKYGDAGVRLNVQPEGDRLVVAVIDDGPGIPEDQLEAVMQPFYRVEGSRNRDTGGTGLGLAIAQQLATAMGAKLALRNRPRAGWKRGSTCRRAEAQARMPASGPEGPGARPPAFRLPALSYAHVSAAPQLHAPTRTPGR
jgi:signal transduction histidine kinase